MKYAAFFLILISMFLVSCEDDGGGVGTCTITRNGQDPLVLQVTFEECQARFPSVVGATGWSWEG